MDCAGGPVREVAPTEEVGGGEGASRESSRREWRGGGWSGRMGDGRGSSLIPRLESARVGVARVWGGWFCLRLPTGAQPSDQRQRLRTGSIGRASPGCVFLDSAQLRAACRGGIGMKARRALPSERPREPFAGRVPAAAHEAGSIEEGGRRKRGRMRARFAACAFFSPGRACPHLLPDVLAGAWGFLFVPKKYPGHGAPVPPPLSGTRYHKLTRSRASRDTCLVPEKSLGHGPESPPPCRCEDKKRIQSLLERVLPPMPHSRLEIRSSLSILESASAALAAR